MKNSFQQLHERALIAVRNFKKSELDLLNILSEIDSAKAYLDLGFSSLFTYAVKALGLSEAQSYSFMAVARKSKEVPELKTSIAEGRLSISKAAKIVSVLKPQTAEAWIIKAATLPRIALEKEVARESGKTFATREVVRIVGPEITRLYLNFSDAGMADLKSDAEKVEASALPGKSS